MLRVFVFIFKNTLKSTWAIFFCCPAALFQQACRMKASLLHPPGVIPIILKKMNPTNPTNPNILKKLGTLEWMNWASVEEDNNLLLKVEGGLPLATAVLLYFSLYQSSDQLLSCLGVFWPNHGWSSLLLLWALSRFSWHAGSRGSSVIFVSYKLARGPPCFILPSCLLQAPRTPTGSPGLQHCCCLLGR